MHKHLSLLLSFAVITVIACERTVNILDDSPQIPDTGKTIQEGHTTFVTLEQAKNTADMFMGSKDLIPLTKVTQTDSPGEASVQSIDKDGEILMYVINYAKGGFVIISATRNYLPILAYSEEGHFDTSSVKGGLSLWVDETMTAIKTSGEKADSIKAEMNRLWRIYEETEQNNSIQTKSSSSITYTPGEIACMERCEELFNQYSGEGWNFLPLSLAEHIFDEAGLSYYYDNLCYSAEFNHSELSSSVVGWKNGSFSETFGPMLSTNWHQDAPFNNLCGGYSAGCGVIAFAQLMKYHEHPEQIIYKGESFGWDTIPDAADPLSNQSKLIKKVREETNTLPVIPLLPEVSDLSWTTPAGLEEGIISFEYDVIRQDDNTADIKNEILNNHRPVIILGHQTNDLDLPGSLEYVGNSHYWVVEGVRSVKTDVFMVFAEWQPYDCGDFTISHYSIDNPNIISGVSYLYYYNNYGWGYGHNAWYAFNHDYPYVRQNFFISPSYND